jgi:DNA-directed RNA polymerase subunit beta'
MALGAFWMTKIVPGAKGEGKSFASPNAAITAYDFGVIDIRAKVQVLATDTEKYAQYDGKIFETSVGRLLFNSVLPSAHPFINDTITQRTLFGIIIDLIDDKGIEVVPPIVDRMKRFGFEYATKSGTTWGIDDVVVPEKKKDIIERARGEEAKVVAFFSDGLISRDERRRMIIEIWHRAKTDIEAILPETLDVNGSVYDMLKSGARGSLGQIAMMAGMKGLIVNTRGETLEFPILSSMKEGMSPIEYFITTHGSRKGLAECARSECCAHECSVIELPPEPFVSPFYYVGE